MWNRESIYKGLEAARCVVKPDGGDIVLVEADEKRGCIYLRLEVSSAGCEGGACLLPGRMLEGVIRAKLQEHLQGEFEVRLEDPRSSVSA